jgi:hypothetical protein
MQFTEPELVFDMLLRDEVVFRQSWWARSFKSPSLSCLGVSHNETAYLVLRDWRASRDGTRIDGPERKEPGA